MQFIKHSPSLPGPKPMEIQRRTQPRDNYVSFVSMCSPVPAFDRKENRIIAVRALQNIAERVKLYVEYSFEY